MVKGKNNINNVSSKSEKVNRFQLRKNQTTKLESSSKIEKHSDDKHHIINKSNNVTKSKHEIIKSNTYASANEPVPTTIQLKAKS